MKRKFTTLFLVLGLCSMLFFACSSKDTAKAAPTPPDTSGTAPTGTTVEEGTGTGTVESGTTPTDTKNPEATTPGTAEQPGTVTEQPGTAAPAGTAEVPGTTSDEKMGATTTDAQLATAVREKLSSSAPSGVFDLTIVAQDGVVTLNGKVSSQDEANRLVTLAKSVPNVKDVVSNLTIESQP